MSSDLTAINFPLIPNGLDPKLSVFFNELKAFNNELLLEMSFIEKKVNQDLLNQDIIDSKCLNSNRIEGFINNSDINKLYKESLDIKGVVSYLKEDINGELSSSKSNYLELENEFKILENKFIKLDSDLNVLKNDVNSIKIETLEIKSQVSTLSKDIEYPLIICSVSQTLKNQILNYVLPEYEEYGIKYLDSLRIFLMKPDRAYERGLYNNNAKSLWNARKDRNEVIQRWNNFRNWDDQTNVWSLIDDLNIHGRYNTVHHKNYSESMIYDCIEYFKDNKAYYDKAFKLYHIYLNNDLQNSVISQM